jgi:membrane protease YdiL (CAAX protease family)
MWTSIHRFLAAGVQEANHQQRALLNSRAAGRPDFKVMTVLVSTAVLLTLQHYVFRSSHSGHALTVVQNTISGPAGDNIVAWATAAENRRLFDLLYWAIGQQIIYVLIPVAIITLAFREPLAEYGVKLRGLLRFGPLYAAMILVMTPLVLWASTAERFRETYPFYRLAPGEPLWPRFVVWEIFYALQFVALEFFFRGYVLHGVKHRFGAYAIFVMMVPYCMIHFAKPLPETFGAIIAGVVLGFMSLATRSIWMGALLHIAVALTMDLAALGRRLS